MHQRERGGVCVFLQRSHWQALTHSQRIQTKLLSLRPPPSVPPFQHKWIQTRHSSVCIYQLELMKVEAGASLRQPPPPGQETDGGAATSIPTKTRFDRLTDRFTVHTRRTSDQTVEKKINQQVWRNKQTSLQVFLRNLEGIDWNVAHSERLNGRPKACAAGATTPTTCGA